MQLKISTSISPFRSGISNPFYIDTTLQESIFQPNSLAVCPATIRLNRLSPCKRRRTEQATSKTRPLFIGPIDQTNRDRWPAVKILRHAAQHLKSSQNTKTSIQPTTIWN